MNEPVSLEALYNACEPSEPASESSYVDCSEARGSTVLGREFLRNLKLSRGRLKFLFSGHVGCGKSSELGHLSRTLREESFFTVLLDGNDYLDDYDTHQIDLLLAIIGELVRSVRRELQAELSDGYLSSRWEEIKDLLSASVQLSEIPLPYGKLELLKKDRATREAVRKAMAPQQAGLVEEVNLLLDRARAVAGQKGFQDVVLVLDNLERIQRFEDRESVAASMKELFLERSPLLTGLTADAIFTLPLRLARSPEAAQLRDRYGVLTVLPMVRVFDRGSPEPSLAGQNVMRAILERRLGSLAAEQAVTSEALKFLVKYSGGHIRSFMHFIQMACTHTDRLPISLEAARQALQGTIRIFSTTVLDRMWDKLAELELSADQSIPNDDPDYLTALENLWVLEYVNGGTSEDIFASNEPWYAVNPVVRELNKFQRAVQRKRRVLES